MNPTLPQELLDVRARLASSESAIRWDAAAHFVGLPLYKDVPRPGEAANWGPNEWLDWGSKCGFRLGEKTKHGTNFGHKDFPEIRCGIAGTPGDWRGPMRCATDFRRNYVGQIEAIAMVTVHLMDRLITGALEGFTLTDEPQAIHAQLAALVSDPVNRQKILESKEVASSVSDADGESSEGMYKRLKLLEKEFGYSYRRSFELIGYDTEQAEKWADVHKLAMKGPAHRAMPRAAFHYEALSQLLEQKREEAKLEEEERRMERERVAQAREKVREPGTEEKYTAAIRRTRDAFRSHISESLRTAEANANGLRRSLTLVDQIPFPDFPGAPTEMKAQLLSLHNELESIEVKMEASNAARDVMLAELHTLRREKAAG